MSSGIEGIYEVTNLTTIGINQVFKQYSMR